jgi:hydroxymethylpyrimidine/phosphomethylpyrimidine kinase
MNIGMALPYASISSDVAAMEGRIMKMKQGVRATGFPSFGASRHVARTILAVMRFDPERRAAINMRYSEGVLKAIKDIGLIASFYDRKEEPQEIKEMEGRTTSWGAEQAINRIGAVPDVIYHFGDWGKEPIITLLGATAVEVANKSVEIAKRLVMDPE